MPTESRTEQLLNAYINGDDISNFVPLSRNEQILKDMILGNEQTSSPQSRIESLYKKLDEKIKEGSGGGGSLKTLIDSKNRTSYLFSYYKGESVDDFISYNDTKNVTDMSYMFYECRLLTTVPQLNTSSCTNMTCMFHNCVSLTTVPQLNTNSCTEMFGMFQNCFLITTVPKLNTKKVNNFTYTFYQCKSLETIPEMDVCNATNFTFMFYECYKLRYLKLLNVKANLQIGSGTSWGHLIEKDCLIQIISELIKPSSGTKTLTMGTANKAKIADTYVKLLEDDGTGKYPFEVCTSTDEGAMTIEAYCNSKNWTLA